MAGTLSLRAHHLLCVFGFRGLGYGPAFVTNMRHTVERFFGDGAVEVVLVSGCDDVCAACPHALRGQCSAEQGGDGAVRTVTDDGTIHANSNTCGGEPLDDDGYYHAIYAERVWQFFDTGR